MGLLIYKYEPFWQEVSVKPLILRWPLKPVGLLFFSNLFAGTYLVDISLQFVVETTEWRGINQSILTLWVTQVIYYTGFTLQLCLIECWYPDIRFSDFFVIYVYLLFEGRMVTDYGFIAFLYFFSGDNWPLDKVFWLRRGFHGGSERYDNPRKILHKEHAYWWRSQSKYNFIFIFFQQCTYL